MREEKIQEIVENLEKNPDMPWLILREDQALETYRRVKQHCPGAKLVVKKLMHYIAVNDRALAYLLDLLERERLQMRKVLETYDREIAGIRSLMGREGEAGTYWSPDSVCRPPAAAEEKQRYREELEGKTA